MRNTEYEVEDRKLSIVENADFDNEDEFHKSSRKLEVQSIHSLVFHH